MRVQVRPASSVRSRAGAHSGGPPEQPTAPSTQPNCVETNVTDRAWKPAGVAVEFGAEVEAGVEVGAVEVPGFVVETAFGVTPGHAASTVTARTKMPAVANLRTGNMVSRPRTRFRWQRKS